MTQASRVTGGRPRRSRARRAGWNVVDQGLSALTNVVLSLVVARSVDAEGFGAFSVAFLFFSLVIGVEQSVVGQPLAMRHSHETPEQRRATARLALGAAFAVGLLGSVLAACLAVVVGGAVAPALLALSSVMPFLVAQDAVRMAFFAWSRPRDAALNDAVWAVVQFAAIAVVVQAGGATSARMVLCWGGGAAVAALLGLAQLGALPAVRGALGWAGRHRDVAGFLLLEYVVGVGAFQGGLLLIGASLGLGDVGAIRAAQVLLGPVGILTTAAMTFGVPEVARRSALPPRTQRLAASASGAMVVAAALYLALLLLLPDVVGRGLLGDTWSGASSVLLPVGVASVVACAKLGPAIITYGLGLARRTIWLVSTLGVLAVALMVLGSWWADAPGLAWGLATAQAAIVPWWFLLLRRAVREGVRPAGAAVVEQEPSAPKPSTETSGAPLGVRRGTSHEP